MRDAIAWSYGLLTPEQRHVFRRLSVFRGGFDLASASAIVDDFGQDADPDRFRTHVMSGLILDTVAALLDQSLLVRAEGDSAQPRFRMLKTIEDFGREELRKSGEEDAIFSRFAAYWIVRAEAIWKVTGNLQSLSRATDELAPDQDNLRAALDWLEANDRPRAMQLAGALFWFWYVRGHHSEGLARVDQLLAYSRHGSAPADVARALLSAGAFAHFQGRTSVKLPRLNEALALFRTLGDHWGIGFSQLVLGIISEDGGDYERASVVFEEALTSLEAAGDYGSAGSARYHLAVVAYGQGELDRAESLLNQTLDPSKERLRIASWALQLRGLVELARGHLPEALAASQDSLRQFNAAHYSAGRSEALAVTASIAATAGEHQLAVKLYSVADRQNELRGDSFELPERSAYEAALQKARASLTEDQYAEAWAIGRSWSIEEATNAALAITISTTRQEIPVPVKAENFRGLSRRELDVLHLLAGGLTSEQIAERLYLSPRTVHSHLSTIYRKLNVANRAEAVSFAITNGLAQR